MMVDDEDDPWDLETEVEKLAAEWLGSTGGELLTRGLPRLLNIDLHSRTGLNHLAFMGGRETRSYDDMWKNILTGAAGPVGAAVGNAFRAGDYLKRGEYQRAFESFSPKFFRDISKAYRYHNEGVKDFNGTTLAKSSEYGGWDAFVQAMGFQTSTTARMWEDRSIRKKRETKLKDRRTSLITLWRNADKKSTFYKENILPFNKAQKDKNMRITRGQLIKSRRRQKRAERRMKGGYHSRYKSINKMHDEIFNRPAPSYFDTIEDSNRAIPIQ
jgi:hypothetical protein